MKEPVEVSILLVEDNVASRDATLADVRNVLPGAVVKSVADAAGAVDLLRTEDFDLAICDLKIPARAGELAASDENGQLVIGAIQAEHRYLPVVVLSAYADIGNTERFTSGAGVLAGLGHQHFPMCQVVIKAETGELRKRLIVVAEGLERTSEVPLEAPLSISPLLERAVRQFGLLHPGANIRVDAAGGLSGSQNAVITLTAADRPAVRAFVKLDSIEWIQDEIVRRRRLVDGTLPVGNWAPILTVMELGLRGQSAAFASLAAGTLSLFETLEREPLTAVRVIEQYEDVTSNWNVLGSKFDGSIGDLRRRYITDEVAIGLGVDREEFADVEELSSSSTLRVCHGDFHGDNILVTAGGVPILIDFAYTEQGPAASDAVALELSLIFHPGSPLEATSGELDCSEWMDGHYLDGQAGSEFASACRALALRLDGERAVAESVYAQALRHLKHPNARPEQALAVARSAANRLRRLS